MMFLICLITIIAISVRYYSMRFFKIFIFVVAILMVHCGSGILMAQQRRQPIRNLPYYDQRRLHWGFCLGMDVSDITFAASDVSGDVVKWNAACPEVNPAFVVGLMGDMAITEHLNVRVSPMMRFQQRKVTFHHDDDEVDQKLKTTYLEIPLSLKIATRRINNYRPYLVTGVQAALDMSHESKTPIVFNRLDFGVHIGLGCDFYLHYFKFAPELRFNLGLIDMLDHKRSDLKEEPIELMYYTESLASARNISMSLLFWFE